MPVIPPTLVLAAAPALRPVFLIVMGAFLLLTAWRMTRGTTGWAPRLMLTGAGLLAFGYGVVAPLYQAGVLAPLSRLGTAGTHPDAILLWHAARLVAMNAGWLCFGAGLAIHAGLFETVKSPAPVQAPQPRRSPLHDGVA